MSLLSFVKKSWVFNTHSCRRRSRFSEAKNLAVHIFDENILWCWYSLSCRVCKSHSISSFFVIMMVGYLLLCFFIKPGSMIEKLGELLGPKYSSMEHGVKCQWQYGFFQSSSLLHILCLVSSFRAQALVSRAHLLISSQVLGELQMGPSISWQVQSTPDDPPDRLRERERENLSKQWSTY